MLPSSVFVDVILENNICGEIKYKITTARSTKNQAGGGSWKLYKPVK